MHLELNRKDKTLLVFRYPSICALLSQRGSKGIFLDRLFHNYIEEIGGKKAAKRSPAGDFYREVLLTYRLLFGQDRRSRRLCKAEGGIPRNADGGGGGGGDQEEEDPLLYPLCCHDWETEPIYDEIQAPDARTVYAAQDFPFFGQRLVALQEFTKMLEPTSWRKLYYDRRNLNRFATVWAAIVFGLATLVLAVIGLVLSAVQIAASYKQSSGPQRRTVHRD